MDDFIKIETLVDSSGKRFLSDAQLQPDPALVAEGWERRFTADDQRIQEVVELYSQLGYEVRAEPVHAGEIHEDCTDCHSAILSRFKTIYTRRRLP
jgi:hypothetical protein